MTRLENSRVIQLMRGRFSSKSKIINENFDVKIIMTLTTPNCPVAETLPVDVEEKVKTVEGVKDVKVEITFEPAWSQDLMSDEAKLELGIL